MPPRSIVLRQWGTIDVGNVQANIKSKSEKVTVYLNVISEIELVAYNLGHDELSVGNTRVVR